MTEPSDTPQPAPAADPGASDGKSWSQLWQMPVLLAGMLLLALGVYLVAAGGEKEDYSRALARAGRDIDEDRLDKAQQSLELVRDNLAAATPAEQALHWLLWGDLVYRQQALQTWDKKENHDRILHFYGRARELGQAFDGAHLRRWAMTLVALGRDADALKLLEELRDEPAEQRYMVVRALIERRRQQPNVKPQDVAVLLARFHDELRQETDPGRRRPQEVWAAGLQAQSLLENDSPQAAIDHLLRQVMQFSSRGGDDDLAPLLVLLGRAYQRVGEHPKAEQHYLLAQQKLASDPTNTLHADILVGLAQHALVDRGDLRAALQLFTQASTSFIDVALPAYLDAVIGMADCEARLDSQNPAALAHFGRAIKLLTEMAEPDARREQVTQTARTHYELAFEGGDFDTALNYLGVLAPLYGGQFPAQVLADFALTHERIAEGRLTAVKAVPAGQGEQLAEHAATRRRLFQEAAIHFDKAGAYYIRHADAVTISDDVAHGLSLWRAAACFDSAQQWSKVIDAYARIVKERGTDPRRLEARHKLGLAYLADGQYAPALDLFQQIVDEAPQSPEGYASMVPLARCRLALGDIEAAKRGLLQVVTDHPALTPASPEYREALGELGRLYYQQQEYEPAIERLTEAVQRYGSTGEGALLRFRLADAYRLSIEQLEKIIQDPLPQSRKTAYQQERTRRLEEAQDLFSQVVTDLEAREAQDLSPLESLCYRNAYFYRADCAYDLGRYEQSISLYDMAAKRWEQDPASLVALVQIVNAYAALGRPQEAKVANDRARWQLRRIPEDAFKDPNLPMTRVHWENWLRWTSELNLFGSQANAK